MRITVDGLTWSASGKDIVSEVTLALNPGETVGLIGPNGSGKSSLLRCVAGLRTPAAGLIRYGEADVSRLKPRQRARLTAFVEQSVETENEMRVSDVVALGRTPFLDRWRGLGHDDRLIIAKALDHLGLTALADRPWKTLSGGERQRAHIARALAQQPSCVLLDEPTNHLDIRHQFELMDLLSAADQTVLVALHDLSLAARYCDRLLLMHHGRLVADGEPQEVLTPERLRDVFEIDAEIGHDSLGNPAIACRGPVRR